MGKKGGFQPGYVGSYLSTLGSCRRDTLSHLKISGEPRMARAALSRRAMDGPNVSKLT